MPRKTVRQETELGFKIDTLANYRAAEDIARLHEQDEDLKTKIAGRLGSLLDLMRHDRVTQVKAKAPGGTLYKFEAVSLGEKVKVSKPRGEA